MRCPFCGADNTRVVDSRLADNGESVRRRRECVSCHERYTTFERAELRMPQVIKSDGRREAFNEEKLRAGIFRALEKRPVDVNEIEATINRIRHAMISTGEREVSSKQIGAWAMAELSNLDQVAYVRFASVYMSFQDVDAFSAEVHRLKNEPPSEVKKQQLPLLPPNGKD